MTTKADLEAARNAVQECKCRQSVCKHVAAYEHVLAAWFAEHLPAGA